MSTATVKQEQPPAVVKTPARKADVVPKRSTSAIKRRVMDFIDTLQSDPDAILLGFGGGGSVGNVALPGVAASDQEVITLRFVVRK
jgi:hypothetical protein